MKKSKKCALCQISLQIHERMLKKKLFLGSVSKTFSWFQANYPDATINEAKFHNHFRRHVEEIDYENLKIVSVDEQPDVDTLVTIYKGTADIVNPLYQMMNLHVMLMRYTESVINGLKNDPSDESGHRKFMDCLRESRLQLDAIDKYKVKTPRGSETFVDLSSADPRMQAAMEIDPEKAPLIDGE